MDKEPEVNINGLDDAFKKEHEQAESYSDERDYDKPRFFNLKKKILFIVGAVVLVIIIFVTFLSFWGIYLSKADFNALIKRVDRIEERLANMEARTQYHVVARGESLSQIAGKYGLTVEKLRNLNKMTPRQNIQPGQKLLVSAVKGS
jgi:LysM repeat protein